MEIIYPTWTLSFFFFLLGLVFYASGLENKVKDLNIKFVLFLAITMICFFYLLKGLVVNKIDLSVFFYYLFFLLGFQLTKKLDDLFERFVFPE